MAFLHRLEKALLQYLLFGNIVKANTNFAFVLCKAVKGVIKVLNICESYLI